MDDNLERDLAQRICAMRTERGLSYAELAARSHLSEDYLCGIEIGERDVTIAALGLLAPGLGCSVEDLLGERRDALLQRLIARVAQKVTMPVARDAQQLPIGTAPERDPPAEDSRR